MAVASSDPDLIVVTSREPRALKSVDRERLARRRQLFVDLWTRTLQAVRPELRDAEARVLVRAAHGALNEAVQRFWPDERPNEDILVVVRALLTGLER